MIARIAWWAALLAIGVVTVGLQLDRQATRTPLIAAGVPEPVRSSAQFPLAALALDSGDATRALDEAERLVRRRPMPAEHLRVLAQAQFAAGDVDASALTIQYAAQRGWREPLAQETMLQLALAAGDGPEAARRYMALLLNSDSDEDKLRELGSALLAEPGSPAHQTIVEIAAGGERWHNTFLRRGAMVMPPDAFSEIVNAAAAKGANFDCKLLEQIELRVTRRDASAGARIGAVIADHC